MPAAAMIIPSGPIEKRVESRRERSENIRVRLRRQIGYRVYEELVRLERRQLKTIAGRPAHSVSERLAIFSARDHQRQQVPPVAECQMHKAASLIPALMRQDQREFGRHAFPHHTREPPKPLW